MQAATAGKIRLLGAKARVARLDDRGEVLGGRKDGAGDVLGGEIVEGDQDLHQFLGGFEDVLRRVGRGGRRAADATADGWHLTGSCHAFVVSMLGKRSV